MSMDFGDDRYILDALSDMVVGCDVVSVDNAIMKLSKAGFDEAIVKAWLNNNGFVKTIRRVDIDRLLDDRVYAYPPLVVTYPAYDNRGIPSKIGTTNCISSIREELSKMILEATSEITIVSPYIEDNGIVYFEETLKRKVKKGVILNIIVREYEGPLSDKKKKFLHWVEDSFENQSNVHVYNYHHVSDNRRIESTCHAKIVVVDGRVAYLGSADIKRRAFELNFEAGSIHVGYLARKLSMITKEMINASRELVVGGIFV